MGKRVTIELENMKFYAYHGHFEIEQKVGNHFLVNLGIDMAKTDALQTDRLKDALDYQRVYALVRREMEKPSHLLEHVANRISEALFTDFQEITRLRVKISKMNPPMGGEMEKVSVTLDEGRE